MNHVIKALFATEFEKFFDQQTFIQTRKDNDDKFIWLFMNVTTRCQPFVSQLKDDRSNKSFIFLSTSWITLPDLSAQGCRALQFVSPKEGKALVNHVIKNVSVGSSDVCEIECYLDNRCLSYNYGDQGNVRQKCELSDSDHKQHPNDLQERLGYIYRGTEVHIIKVNLRETDYKVCLTFRGTLPYLSL